MKFLFRKKIFLTALIFGFFPLLSFASEIRLDASKVGVQVGEVFTVEVILFADEPVNAIEGRIIFSEDMLVVKEVRDGNSSINLWLEKPHIDSSGAVIFSGITPGGMIGTNNLLFSITFEARKTGPAPISISRAKALQNDGVGTELSLAFRNVAIEVKEGDGNARKVKVADEAPPEPFTATIAQNPSMFDGEWFIAFATTDKGTGVSRYEIKEYRFNMFAFLKPWRIAESPQLLSDQALKSHISIRAIDGAGNARITEVFPTHPLPLYEFVFYWFIIISIMCGAFYGILKLWRKI